MGKQKGRGYWLAVAGRNHAGLLVGQLSKHSKREWSYDQLGRVSQDVVYCLNGGGGTNCETGTTMFLENASYLDSHEVEVLSIYRNVSGWDQHDFQFDYDDQHQLVGAKDTSGAAVPYSVSWVHTPGGKIVAVGPQAPFFDAVGRESAEHIYGDGTLSGGDEHAVIALNGPDLAVDYVYDPSANQISRKESIYDPATKSTTATSWTFDYDGSSQLRAAAIDGVGRELYYYDEGGQRYMAVRFTGAGTLDRIRVWNGAVETWYDANGNVISDWSHVSLGAQDIARIDDQSTVELSYHNGLKHFMGSLDFETGNLLSAFVYGPFGEIIAQSGDTGSHLRRFNGKEDDQISRLGYYGFRYYDQQSLSWTQSDPLYRVVPDLAYDQPRLMSLYAFSLNNPVRYMDPDGRSPTRVVRQGGAAIVAGAGVLYNGFKRGLQGDFDDIDIDHDMISRIFNGAADSAHTPEGASSLYARRSQERAEAYRAQRKKDWFARNEAYTQSLKSGEDPHEGRTLNDDLPARDTKPSEADPHAADPDAEGPHTTVGTKTNPKKSPKPYRTGIEYDADGRPVRKIDKTDHGRGDHDDPHQHPYDPDKHVPSDPNNPGDFGPAQPMR